MPRLPTQRNAAFVVQRDRAAAEGDRMGVEHRPEVLTVGNAKFRGGLLDDSERCTELLSRLLAERRAGVACSLYQGSRSVGSLIAQQVQYGPAPPAEIMFGQRPESRRRDLHAIRPSEVS